MAAEWTLMNVVPREGEEEGAWLREERALWRQGSDECALEVATVAGSVWGDFGRSCPAVNTRLLHCGAVRSAQVRLEMWPKTRGEQAGMCWWASERDYVKLVVEGMRDGRVALVLAVQEAGDPRVVAKRYLGESDEQPPAYFTLTLDLSHREVGGAAAGDVARSPRAPPAVRATVSWPQKSEAARTAVVANLCIGQVDLPTTLKHVYETGEREACLALIAHGGAEQSDTENRRYARFLRLRVQHLMSVQ
jgi:hypothetical protein